MPSVCVPPLSTSCRWSASVAGLRLHQWHMGLPSSSSALARLYSALSYSLTLCSLVFVANALALAGCGCCHGSERVGGWCPSRILGLSPWLPFVSI